MKYIIMCLCISTATAAWSQEPALNASVRSGWLDSDGDGRHDLFLDADGDGINDVDRQRYAHRFAWADADGDDLNDIYRDADGDGVNDLDISFRDHDGDGLDDNVLDMDGDGRNDITGLAYGRNDLHGEKFGFVLDGAGWVDEDGDGFADLMSGQGRSGRQDRFIDSDGDGLADGCWFEDGGFQHHRARSGQGGGAGGGPRRAGSGGNGGGRWSPDFGSA